MRMKEHLYAWYPSARDIYTNARTQLGYEKECMYKYWKRGYSHVGTVVPRPRQSRESPRSEKNSLRPKSTPVNASKFGFEVRGSKPPTVKLERPTPRNSPAVVDHLEESTEILDQNSTSENINQIRNTSKETSLKVRPRSQGVKSWYTNTPATPVKLDVQQQHRQTSPYESTPCSNTENKLFTFRTNHLHQGNYTDVRQKEDTPFRASLGSGSRAFPKRPVRSAVPTRPFSALCRSERNADTGVRREQRPHSSPCRNISKSVDTGLSNKSEKQSIKSITNSNDRVIEQKPSIKEPIAKEIDDNQSEDREDREDLDKEIEDTKEKKEYPLNYEEQLKKYGWRMEIPGDPYNLKRPCIPKRYPYTVECKVAEVPPNPPTAHLENWDTFFMNTIPKRPLSFTIHKEWASELIHAKRMQLQKKDARYPYRYKDFSFVY